MGRAVEMESWEEVVTVYVREWDTAYSVHAEVYLWFLKINTTECISWVFLAFTVNSALFIHCTYPKGPI
jgi:hypothetical protein